MPLTPDALQAVAIAGVVVGLFAILLALVALHRLNKLRRSRGGAQPRAVDAALVDAVSRQGDEFAELGAEVGGVQAQLTTLRGELSDAIRHVAVVRYDAFQDMGGRMSFSAALLDDAGDGLVLTSINGRSETRTYAKGVKGADGDAALSPEEEQAIAYAMRDADAESTVTRRHRRPGRRSSELEPRPHKRRR